MEERTGVRRERALGVLSAALALLVTLGVVGAVAGWWPSAEERAAAAVCDRWTWDQDLSAPENERQMAALVQQYGASFADAYALAADRCPGHLNRYGKAVSRLDIAFEPEQPTAARMERCLRVQEWVDHTFAGEPAEHERWRAIVAACYARVL